MSKVSLKDVAKDAGVSVATVSRILNNDGSFSQQTVNRVLKTVERLEYVPRLSYRNAMKQFSGKLGESGRRRTNNIALLCSRETLEHPSMSIYQVETFREKALVAQENGFSLLITVVEDNVHVPDPILDEKVDAIICRFDAEAALLRRMAAHVPVVLSGYHSPDVDLSSIRVDEYRAHRKVLDHLKQLGHKRIAYLSDARSSPYNYRYDMVMRAFKDLGLQAHDDLVKPISIESVFEPQMALEQAVGQILNGAVRPTAILTSEFWGFHLMTSLLSRGVKVPEDMSVAVIGDNLWALHGTEIQITAVRYPMAEMARWGVEEAVALVENPAHPIRHVEVEASLIPRASSGPAPK